MADPNSPPSGRAVGGGTAPDLRRPSQWWKAPPPGTPFRHPHSEQRRPARAHAVGPVLGLHARTDRTRDTRFAEVWLPAPDDRRPGDGQRLTPGAPHNGGRPAPPRGRPPTTPAACSPHRASRPRGRCWAPTPTHPRPQHVGGGPQQPAQWAGSRERDSAWTQTPLTMDEGTPPGDALPPTPQRATPARKGARCGAGAGSPLPHRPHPGHTGRGTLAARSRGRAAGGGTVPDTRRPSQRWQATPPGDGPPPPPRHAAPTGHAAQGDSVGPPHPHTRAHSTWVADPNSPPSGRAVGGGTAPDLRRPSQWWKAPPPGDVLPPPPKRATPARKGARCGAGAGSPRPHRPHPGHTGRGTLAARSRGRAAGGGTVPDTRRPSQRWQANPPGDGPPPHPRHAAPTGHGGRGDGVGLPHPHTRAHSTWVADPNSPPSGRAVGGGTAPDLRRPSQWWKAPPPGTPFRHPTASNAGPQGRMLWGRCWVPTPAPTAPGTHGSRNPGCPLQRTGGRGRDIA